jgi:hypothetical protein
MELVFMWRFVFLRIPFVLDLLSEPDAVSDRLFLQTQPGAEPGFFKSPSEGEYFVGDVSTEQFALQCLKCVRRGRSVNVERRVVAKGAFIQTVEGCRVEGVVRQLMVMRAANLMLFVIAMGCLVVSVLVLLTNVLGPQFGTEVGAEPLFFVLLWAWFNFWMYRAVTGGRDQLVRALTEK